MRKIKMLLEFLIERSALIAGLSVTLMMVHICATVVLRSTLGIPLHGTITFVSNYYMVILTFSTIAYAEMTGRHINVDLLYSKMPVPLRRVADFVSVFASVTVYFILMKMTWDVAVRQYNSGALISTGALDIVVWPSYFVLPLGFLLALVAVFVKKRI